MGAGIAVVVLTVTFIEMVLPRSDLKRYVDVVVGLAVIGAILTPLLGLGMGIGAGLELATTAARSWSESFGPTLAETGPGRLGGPGVEAYAGAGGNYREVASSIASRALETRVRQAIAASYGSEAESWAVKVRVTDAGVLESVEVEMDVPAASADSRACLTRLRTQPAQRGSGGGSRASGAARCGDSEVTSSMGRDFLNTPGVKPLLLLAAAGVILIILGSLLRTGTSRGSQESPVQDSGAAAVWARQVALQACDGRALPVRTRVKMRVDPVEVGGAGAVSVRILWPGVHPGIRSGLSGGGEYQRGAGFWPD